MKPAATLTELLKPPFEWKYGYFISGKDRSLFYLDFDKYLFNSENLAAFKDFLVSALNEKWEHDFGEPLRWIVVWLDNMAYLRCPKCEDEHFMGNNIQNNNALIRGYCPNCCQRLLPPEEGE